MTDLDALNRAKQILEANAPSTHFTDAAYRSFHSDLDGSESRSLQSSTDTSGVVGTEYAKWLSNYIETSSAAAQLCRRVVMKGHKLSIPTVDSAPAAEWVAEGSAVTQADPVLVQREFTAAKVAVSTRVSAEFLEDSVVDMTRELAETHARQLSLKVDDAILNGAGAPANITGIIPSLTRFYDCPAGDDHVSNVDLRSLVSAVGVVSTEAVDSDLAWLMHPSVAAQCANSHLAYAAGSSRELSGKQPTTLLGFPLVTSIAMPASVAPGGLFALFGDFRRGAVYCTRRDAKTRVFDATYAAEDSVLIMTTARVSGGILDPQFITGLRLAS
jgi:HK97 family phage major capsid protein